MIIKIKIPDPTLSRLLLIRGGSSTINATVAGHDQVPLLSNVFDKAN